MCSSPTQKSNIPSSISIDPLLLCPLTFSVCNFMNTVTKLYHPTKLNKTLLILPNNHLVLRTCTKCTASTVPLERTLAQSGPAMRLPATPLPPSLSLLTHDGGQYLHLSPSTHTHCYLGNTVGAAPVPRGDGLEGRVQAEHVVAAVTAVAEQHLLLTVLSATGDTLVLLDVVQLQGQATQVHVQWSPS